MNMILEIIVCLLFLIVFAAGGWLVYIGIDAIKDDDKFVGFLAAFLGAIFIITPASIIGYVVYDTYETSNCTEISQTVKAEVINKEYKPEWIQIISTGKTTTSVIYPEEWDITITDKDIKQIIDNKALYNALNTGDKIEATKTTWTKKNGDIYKKELSIPN